MEIVIICEKIEEKGNILQSSNNLKWCGVRCYAV